MRFRPVLLAGLSLVLLSALPAPAEVKVIVDRNEGSSASAAFKFKLVPSPAKLNAATNAKFSIVDGQRDTNGAEISALNDGKLPAEEDSPASNFFFNAGTPGGRIEADLGSVIQVKQINTYSWHAGTRAPQVYKLYGSDGAAGDFNAKPKGIDPATVGWKLIAKVDTRPKDGDAGGQYAVSVSDSDGPLGKFRYLLFDVSQTEAEDPFGNTFYSEIDVIDQSGTQAVAANKPAEKIPPLVFHSHNPDCEIIIDISAAPDLRDWVETKLGPTLAEWYPKISEMLPSEGYTPPKTFTVSFPLRTGVANTSWGGTTTVVRANPTWLKSQFNREAVGAMVHEEVHVVQQYNGANANRRGGAATRAEAATRPAGATTQARRSGRGGGQNTGWLTEGIADYIRWWYYEPDGPRRYPRVTARTKYDGSYTVSANFLHWVAEKYDKDIVMKMNAAMREHRYNPDLWKEYTGKTIDDLGAEWLKSLSEPRKT